MTPITPAEARKKAETSIPQEVIEAVNELIAEKIGNGRYVTLLQKEVVNRICKKMPTVSAQILFDKHWLDFEDVFRRAGWQVEYDKPAYCETYEANWTFEG